MSLEDLGASALPSPARRSHARHAYLSTDQILSRLEILGSLPAQCTAALRAALTSIGRRYPPRHKLFEPGCPIDGVHLIRSGVACRYSTLREGRRQITALLLPADLCDATAGIFGEIDHVVAATNAIETVFLPREALLDLSKRFPQLQYALWLTARAQAAVCHRWMLNLGRRSALERIALLLCEVFTRMNDVGLAAGNACRLPITQHDIADAVALTPIHVNRTLMELRRRNLATLRRQELAIPEFAALAEVCDFDPGYLLQPELSSSG
jgi:CRP-like cAMP-binding protein